MNRRFLSIVALLLLLASSIGIKQVYAASLFDTVSSIVQPANIFNALGSLTRRAECGLTSVLGFSTYNQCMIAEELANNAPQTTGVTNTTVQAHSATVINSLPIVATPSVAPSPLLAVGNLQLVPVVNPNSLPSTSSASSPSPTSAVQNIYNVTNVTQANPYALSPNEIDARINAAIASAGTPTRAFISGQTDAVYNSIGRSMQDLASGMVFNLSSSTGLLSIGNGGTGTSTAPTKGQVLVGNASGSYDLISTSTLLGYSGSAITQNGNSFGATTTIGSADNNAVQIITNNQPRLTVATNGSVNVATTTLNNYSFAVAGTSYLGGNIIASGTLTATALNTTGSTFSGPNYSTNGNVVPAAPYDSEGSGAANFGPNAGQTTLDWINIGQYYRIRETGTVTQTKMYIPSTTGITGFYLEIWRLNSVGTYDLVASSTDLHASLTTGANTLAVNVPVQVGDFIGAHVTYTSASTQNFFTQTATDISLYSVVNGAPTATNYNWKAQTLNASTSIYQEVDMAAPIFVLIGDSVASGHSVSGSFAEDVPTGVYKPNQGMADIVGQSLGYTYQNMAISGDEIHGGVSPAPIVSRYTADVINLHPKFALLEGGNNDLNAGFATATILADWTTIISNVSAAGIEPVVMGIIPFRGYAGASDTTATGADYLNGQLKALAAAYGGVYVDSTPMGNYWPTGPAGNSWALRAQYDDGSGIHMNAAGNAREAQLIVAAMSSTTIQQNLSVADVSLQGDAVLNSAMNHRIFVGANSGYEATGTDLFIQAGGASQSGTADLNGGNLYLQSGNSNGLGTSVINFQIPQGTVSAATATPVSTALTLKQNSINSAGVELQLTSQNFSCALYSVYRGSGFRGGTGWDCVHSVFGIYDIGSTTDPIIDLNDSSKYVTVGKYVPYSLEVISNQSGNDRNAATFKAYSTATQGIVFAYSTTTSYGTIQANTEGVSNDNLALDPNGGKVGIGTTTPTQALTVAGFIDTNGGINIRPGSGFTYQINNLPILSASTSINNIFLGSSGPNPWNATGTDNVSLGKGDLGGLTGGTRNTVLGGSAATVLNFGGSNVVIGFGGLAQATSSNNNVAIGPGALNHAVDPSVNNIAIGINAASGLTTSANNIIIGINDAPNLTTGNGHNLAFGSFSMQNLSSGSNNMFLGDSSDVLLSASTSATDMIVIGHKTIGGCSNCMILGATTSADSLGIEIGTTSSPVGQFVIAATSTGNIIFNVLPSGKIGIGSTTPQGQLAIAQSLNNATSGLTLSSTGGKPVGIYMDDTGQLNFTANGVTASLSNTGTWTNGSDLAYKTNIVDLGTKYGLNAVLATDPRYYDMKETGIPQVGFIAEELKAVIPEVVTGTPGAEGVSYGNLVAVAFQAIKDLNTKIDTAIATAISNIKDLVLNTLTTQTVTTNELCVGTTCVTKDEFMSMVMRSGIAVHGSNYSASSTGGSVVTASVSTGGTNSGNTNTNGGQTANVITTVTDASTSTSTVSSATSTASSTLSTPSSGTSTPAVTPSESPTPTSTPTPTVTPTPTPSSTPSPTTTPAPTTTPTPVVTSSPTPTETPAPTSTPAPAPAPVTPPTDSGSNTSGN